MGVSDIAILVGAFGGFEAIKWAITAIYNKKSIKKQAEAEAVHSDLVNLNDYADSWRELYIEAKQDTKDKDEKIDRLYVEIRELREDISKHNANEHRLELENEALRFKNCDVRKCLQREPQTGY